MSDEKRGPLETGQEEISSPELPAVEIQDDASATTAVAAGPRRAAAAFIFLTVSLDMLALGMIAPVLPRLIMGFLNGNAATAAQMLGLFGTVFALMQFFFSPVLGSLSDRFGRRPVVLLSNFGLGFDYLLMAWAPELSWLFLGRIISGITASSIPTALAYIADVTPREKRAAAFGMLNAGERSLRIFRLAGIARGQESHVVFLEASQPGWFPYSAEEKKVRDGAGRPAAVWLYRSTVFDERLRNLCRLSLSLDDSHHWHIAGDSWRLHWNLQCPSGEAGGGKNRRAKGNLHRPARRSNWIHNVWFVEDGDSFLAWYSSA
jgi:hypothetical protein